MQKGRNAPYEHFSSIRGYPPAIDSVREKALVSEEKGSMRNFISQDQVNSEIDSDRISQEKTIPMRALYAPIKVPEVTVFFWMIKLLTTALGESTSDFLVNSMSPVHAVALGALGLVVTLALQFVVRRYIPWIY